MLLILSHALAFSGPSPLPELSGENFCDLVDDNHGCCLACGYAWIDGLCTTDDEHTTMYCKSLEEPQYTGCSRYCKYAWTGSRCKQEEESSSVELVSFDGGARTTRKWQTVDDPVMGGVSSSIFDVEQGVWSGEVRIVKSSGQPGFCTLRTAGTELFPDCRDTTHLVLRLGASSGLPITDFSLEVGVKGVTNEQTFYVAKLTGEHCCDHACCRVSWSDFQLSFRGKAVPGPSLAEHLDGVTQIGLGISGHAGPFSMSLESVFATDAGLEGVCV